MDQMEAIELTKFLQKIYNLFTIGNCQNFNNILFSVLLITTIFSLYIANGEPIFGPNGIASKIMKLLKLNQIFY